jgi:hypothetical protein
MEERMGRPAARLACHGRRSLRPHAGEGRIGKLAATARDRGADGPACDLAACHGRPDAMQGLGCEAHTGAREEGESGAQACSVGRCWRRQSVAQVRRTTQPVRVNGQVKESRKGRLGTFTSFPFKLNIIMSLVSYSKLTLLQQCVTAKSRNFSGLQQKTPSSSVQEEIFPF